MINSHISHGPVWPPAQRQGVVLSMMPVESAALTGLTSNLLTRTFREISWQILRRAHGTKISSEGRGVDASVLYMSERSICALPRTALLGLFSAFKRHSVEVSCISISIPMNGQDT